MAVFLPYLLLSLFVDFVHLHPLLSGDSSQISASPHVGTCSETRPKAPQAACAICQWLRTGIAIRASAAASPAMVRLPDKVTLNTVFSRGSPAVLAIELRGPPSFFLA